MKMFLRGCAVAVSFLTLLFVGGAFVATLFDAPTHLSDAAIGLWFVQQVNVFLPIVLLCCAFAWLLRTMADMWE